MVEVFKTDVQKESDADKIVRKLLEHFPTNKINFDLEDCDKILRVEGDNLNLNEIVSILNGENFLCEILYD